MNGKIYVTALKHPEIMDICPKFGLRLLYQTFNNWTQFYQSKTSIIRYLNGDCMLKPNLKSKLKNYYKYPASNHALSNPC